MRHPTRMTLSAPDDAFGLSGPGVATGLAAGWLVDAPTLSASSPQHAAACRMRPPLLGAMRRQLRRWERRAASCLWTPKHPLEDELALAGLDLAERRHLLRHFQDRVPADAWTDRHAALLHLQTLLLPWRIEGWSNVCGLQLFLGAAGAGKTTLVFTLAHELARAGRRVTTIALLARPAPQRAAFRSFAAEAGVEAVFASSASELEHALAAASASHAILLDTPCLLTHGPALDAALRHPLLRHPRTVLHLCLSLQHARAVQTRALQHAARHHFDCLAVSHLDLAPGGGALVAAAMHSPRPISLAHASPEPLVPPFPCGTRAFAGTWGLSWN